MTGKVLIGVLCALGWGPLGCDAAQFDDPNLLDFELRSGGGGRLARPAQDGETRSGGGDWINNGLMSPMVSGIDVDHSLVSSNGLSKIQGWLADENDDGVNAIRYMIQCALAEGQTIKKNYKGQKTEFHGHLGLAPQWRDGACDEDCQQWVSACLMARTNPTGQTTDIWIEAQHLALGTGANPEFPLHEGGFYGNLFAGTQVAHTCRGDANALAAASAEGRTCTASDEDCGFVTDGDCMLEADCDLTDSGLPAACRPTPEGPSYPVINVHVAEIPAG